MISFLNSDHFLEWTLKVSLRLNAKCVFFVATSSLRRNLTRMLWWNDLHFICLTKTSNKSQQNMSSINLPNIKAVLMSRAYKKHASFHSRHVTYWFIWTTKLHLHTLLKYRLNSLSWLSSWRSNLLWFLLELINSHQTLRCVFWSSLTPYLCARAGGQTDPSFPCSLFNKIG